MRPVSHLSFAVTTTAAGRLASKEFEENSIECQNTAVDSTSMEMRRRSHDGMIRACEACQNVCEGGVGHAGGEKVTRRQGTALWRLCRAI